MRNIYCLIILVISSATMFAQAKKKTEDEDKVFQKVEMHATPLNQASWNAMLKKIATVPESMAQSIPAGKYEVTLQFIVDQHGYITQVKLLQDPGFGLGARALGILSKYDGKWKPESQCGVDVKAYKKQLITINIGD